MNKIKYYTTLTIALLLLIPISFGFDLNFEEGKNVNLNIEEGLFFYDFNLIISNTDFNNLVSKNSNKSYLKLKSVGIDLYSTEILNNPAEGIYIDKGNKVKVKVRLKLSRNQEWKEKYKIEIEGISPTGTQKLGFIEITPKNVPKQFQSNKTNYVAIFFIILVSIGIIYGIKKLYNNKKSLVRGWE